MNEKPEGFYQRLRIGFPPQRFSSDLNTTLHWRAVGTIEREHENSRDLQKLTEPEE
jgi:hypothetical protein